MTPNWTSRYKKTEKKSERGAGQLADQTGQPEVTASREIPPIARYALFFSPLILTSMILYSYYVFFCVFIEGGSHYLFESISVERLDISNLLKERSGAVSIGRTYAARILWTAFTNLHLLLSLAAVVYGFSVFISYLKGRGLFKVTAGFLGVVSVFACMIIIFVSREHQWTAYAILEMTVKSEVGNILRINTFVDVCSLAAALFLAFTSAVMILGMASQVELTVGFLHRIIREQRTLLFVSAAVLVSGIVQLSASLNWAMAAFSSTSDNTTNNFRDLVSSLINSRALYYSLILCAIYAPGMLFLKKQTHALAEAKSGFTTATEHEDWLKKNGLHPSYAEKLPRFAAILAPMLTGFAAQLAKSIM